MAANQASGLISEGLSKAAGTAGFGFSATPIGVLIGKLLSAVLGLMGLALVVLLIYGGILYLTAAGNQDQVKKAKSAIINAVIGITIVAASYAIATFVVAQLQHAGREELELSPQELADICALDPTSSACPEAPTTGAGQLPNCFSLPAGESRAGINCTP